MARSSHASSSGSQYAVCALGVGLIALGVVMIVWSVVPGNTVPSGNNSKPELGPETDSTKGKTSSVAFVLVGSGVAMLLLSICLSIRNKHRQNRREAEATDVEYEDNESPDERPEVPEGHVPAYNVPSYDEVVGSNDYPVRQSNLHNSLSLPSYESLADALAIEASVEAATNTDGPTPAPAATQQPPQQQAGCQKARSSKKFRPLKVRRIKSDKLHLKDFRLKIQNSNNSRPDTIEPLTPPPMYDEEIQDKNLPV
ncbi:TMM51 protein, partial [Polyodon spathula]|nr:transmembrane protein 51-like [Polyodon spathula]XP_041129569.1 transmembrane protein 51-like [Polyodon spathula]XP_041129570.1 transmembrane protein 51-like [Polyodon spathula]MBN3273119.1 TMM51 protein [Polyodon spathula]